MRISTAGRYALRAMIDVAQHQEQGPVQRHDIAVRQEITNDYLAQLFVKLRRAGLVTSVRGPKGGYVLAKNAAEISAGDILYAVEESMEPVFCLKVESEKTCHRAPKCATHLLWTRLGEAMTQVLDASMLAELCESAWMLEQKD